MSENTKGKKNNMFWQKVVQTNENELALVMLHT